MFLGGRGGGEKDRRTVSKNHPKGRICKLFSDREWLELYLTIFLKSNFNFYTSITRHRKKKKNTRWQKTLFFF